ncbi:tRNA (adenosine(37)-N6)-threonylcarbamoyltransferase complex ATPase subunit type 1 TsaE [Candidatus Dependentiae bacterium]|jgi:tRNA threonylcarbamoyladenosine biosynthesis protein TsaE|nr:tRNA (adenosine(37)-N6)-threonylcarbamoyltransferase complex ATPase subunit type 1 TsaE [Candidatus Dependentiae bacterium]
MLNSRNFDNNIDLLGLMDIIFNQENIPAIVKKEIIPLLAYKNIFTLHGPMGAGKTTLVKEILQQSGVTQTVVSPTFGYVNTYHGSHNRIFYHFDLYRLSSIDEFIGAGFDEYFSQKNSFIIIEWPDLIDSLLATSELIKRTQSIKLSYDPNDFSCRIIRI